jgi:hypothetical protein
MALIEKTIIDKIELVENNSIQVRTATIIEKDGAELTRSYHRHVVCPGNDITNEDAKVQAIANAIWTEDVILAYKQQTQAQIEELKALINK